MAKQSEMLFGMLSWVGRGNHVY